MKLQSYIVLGFLALPGCGDYGSMTQGSCSCGPPPLNKIIRGSIEFDKDHRFNDDFIGFYGLETNCCTTHGESSLEGYSRHLTTEPLESNYYALYSSKTYIMFSGAFPSNQWTLQLWLNPSVNTPSGIIMEESIDSKRALFLSLTDDRKLSLNLPPSDKSMSIPPLIIESSRALTTDTWQHIAVTLSEDNEDNVAFYIDGTLDKRQAYKSDYNILEARSDYSSSPGTHLCFGSCLSDTSIDGMSFQGKIGKIEFINKVLEDSDIRSNHQSSQSSYSNSQVSQSSHNGGGLPSRSQSGNLERDIAFTDITMSRAELEQCVKQETIIDQLEEEIGEKKTEIASLKRQVQASESHIERERVLVNPYSQLSVDNFNSLLPTHKKRVAEYNAKLPDYSSLIEQKNTAVNSFQNKCTVHPYHIDDMIYVRQRLGL